LMAVCNSYIGGDALAEFIRRLVFTIAIANADAHMKNWSLLYRNRRAPSLSPAYDYVCIAAYQGYDDFLALPLGKAVHWEALREETFMLAARKARVLPREVWSAASEMIDRIIAVWPQVRNDVPPDARVIIERQLGLPLFKKAA
jgi:serine/threonine-protein kinase HipA